MELARRVSEEFGADFAQIGKMIGVTERTVRRWIDEHKTFKDAIDEGRTKYDSNRVKGSLVQRAVGGFETKTTTLEPVVGKDGKVSLQVVRVVKREMPGDIRAQEYWLNNKSDGEFKHKSDLNIGGQEDSPVPEFHFHPYRGDDVNGGDKTKS